MTEMATVSSSMDWDYTITQYVNDVSLEYAQTLLELKTDGTLTNNYRYDPYGATTFGTPTGINYYGYNAESTNATTGLQYLRARYYRPQTGSFITEDTERGTRENPLTRNRYVYVVNNPLNYTDPRRRFLKALWNGVKKVVKKAVNWVNTNIVQPIKKAVTKAVNWVGEKVSAAVDTVKGWFSTSSNGGGNRMGYAYDSSGGYTGSGASYKNLSPNQKAAYMSDADIATLSSGAGLSGKQLARYQEQRAKLKKEQMKREVCSKTIKKADAGAVAGVGVTAAALLEKLGTLGLAGTIGLPSGVIVIPGVVIAWLIAPPLEAGESEEVADAAREKGKEADKGDSGAEVNGDGLPVNGKIKGWTKHGTEQALERDGGAGVSNEAINDAVDNPEEVVEQEGGTTKYVGKDATVVLKQAMQE